MDLSKGLIAVYKSGATSCPQTNPYCVKKEYFVPAWTLHNSVGRYAYGTRLSERDLLTGATMGGNRYTEVCARISGGLQSDFCSNPVEPHAYSGPFIAYSAAKPADGTTRPVYRCYNSASTSYFYTLNASECSAASVYSMNPNVPLFYVSINKTPEMMRALRRCYGSSDTTTPSNYMAVDVARCPAAS